MKRIKGHFNGSVVVLDEPAPVSTEVSVFIDFPDTANKNGAGVSGGSKRIWHWGLPRPETDTYEGSVADELIRQRRDED